MLSPAMTGWARRLAGLHRRQPWVADAGLVALLLLPLLPARIGDLLTTAPARLFTVALVVPLLARRRWPVPVFAIIATTALAQWLCDVRATGDVALLVALYGVAVSQRVSTTLLAAVVLELGVIVAVARWGTGDGGLRAFVGLSGLAVASAVMGTSNRNRQHLVLSLEERAQRLKIERDQQGRLSAAGERARIAREMHDIIAHNVSVMIALADGASYALDEDPERAQMAMQRASATGRHALTEMRRLLGVLRDEHEHADTLAPQPGLAEVDALVEQVRGAGLPVRYELTGDFADLPAGLQLAVYRVVQEALTNTLKHAGAGARAAVRLTRTARSIEAQITNSGGTSVPIEGSGGGLRGMQERAAVYDGVLHYGPTPAGGWQVQLVVPLNPTMITA